MSVFSRLRNVKHSDNLCSVGWTCIHAQGWDLDTARIALSLCPAGHFTRTSHVDSDMRRAWDVSDRREKDEFGEPLSILAKGAYFNMPMDKGCLHLLQRCDLVNELMVLVADGGRHKWPCTETRN